MAHLVANNRVPIHVSGTWDSRRAGHRPPHTQSGEDDVSTLADFELDTTDSRLEASLDGMYEVELAGPRGVCSGRAMIRGNVVQAWSSAAPGRVLVGIAEAHGDEVFIALQRVDQPIGGGDSPCSTLPDCLELVGLRDEIGIELRSDCGLFRIGLTPVTGADRAAG